MNQQPYFHLIIITILVTYQKISKMPYFSYLFNFLQQRRTLVYWVNSINNPYCLLASSSIDFKDGIIFCELLSILKGSKLQGIIYENQKAVDKSLNNISLALKVMKGHPTLESKIKDLTPEKVYNSEDAMYALLEIIKDMFDSGTSKISMQSLSCSEQVPQAISKNSANSKAETAKFPSFQLKAVDFGTVKSPSFPDPAIQEKNAAAINPVQPKQTSNNIPRGPKATTKQPKDIAIANNEQEINRSLSRGILIDNSNPYIFPKSSKPIAEFIQHDKADLINLRKNEEQEPKSVQKRSENIMSEHPSTTERIKKEDYKKRANSMRKSNNISPKEKQRISFRQASQKAKKTEINMAVPVHIDKVQIRTKFKLLGWLHQIRLIKENAVTIAKFPDYCRNGVLFSDLVKRIEGVNK